MVLVMHEVSDRAMMCDCECEKKGYRTEDQNSHSHPSKAPSMPLLDRRALLDQKVLIFVAPKGVIISTVWKGWEY
jgi:hypothetical protein